MNTEYYEYKTPSGDVVHGWIHEQDRIAMQRWQKKMNSKVFRYIMFGKMDIHLDRVAKREEQFPTCHYAYIYIGNRHIMAWVTKDQKQAFKIADYSNSYMPYKTFTFDRWCTSFDL